MFSELERLIKMKKQRLDLEMTNQKKMNLSLCEAFSEAVKRCTDWMEGLCTLHTICEADQSREEKALTG